MADKEKLEKVRAEIERVKKNQEGVFTSYTDGKFDLCEHLLSFINSMQEEPKAKFKVGDKVMPKRFKPEEVGFYLNEPERIIDIVGGYYILDHNQAYKIECQEHWELVEEPICAYSTERYTDEDRKVLCDGCEEKCKYDKSDDFTKALAECIHNAQCNVVDPMVFAETWKDELIKLSKCEEPVSEDLEEEIGKYCSNPENFITYIDVGFKQSSIKKDDIPLIIKAIKFGANWQKQQMMANAIDGFVIEDIEEGNGDFLLSAEYLSKDMGLKDRQKVKVIVIRED